MGNYNYFKQTTSSSSTSGSKFAPIVMWRESPFNQEEGREVRVAETTNDAFVGISDRAILTSDYRGKDYQKMADVQSGLSVKAEIVGYNNLPTNLDKKYWFKFVYADKTVILGGYVGCSIRINSQGFVAAVEENDLTTIDYDDPSFIYYIEPKQKLAALPTTNPAESDVDSNADSDADSDSDDVEKEYGASEETDVPEAKTLTEDEAKRVVAKHNEEKETLERLYEQRTLERLYEQRKELIDALSQNLEEIKAATRKQRVSVTTFPLLPFFDWDFPLWDNWGSRYKPTLWGW